MSSNTKNISPTCAHCGSKLIFVSSKTENFEGSMFPVTSTVYKCPNSICQKDTDKKTALRKKFEMDRKLKNSSRKKIAS